MPILKDNALLPLAKQLRRDMSPWELKLWYLFLRRHPVKVYRQRIVGSYIVDFYCASAKLVIELDGSQHYSEAAEAHDKERTQYMEALGLKVLRFSNYDVDRNFIAVCEAIDQEINTRATPERPRK